MASMFKHVFTTTASNTGGPSTNVKPQKYSIHRMTAAATPHNRYVRVYSKQRQQHAAAAAAPLVRQQQAVSIFTLGGNPICIDKKGEQNKNKLNFFNRIPDTHRGSNTNVRKHAFKKTRASSKSGSPATKRQAVGVQHTHSLP